MCLEHTNQTLSTRLPSTLVKYKEYAKSKVVLVKKLMARLKDSNKSIFENKKEVVWMLAEVEATWKKERWVITNGVVRKHKLLWEALEETEKPARKILIEQDMNYWEQIVKVKCLVSGSTFDDSDDLFSKMVI